MGNITRETVAMTIMVVVAIVTLGLVAYQTVLHQDISPVVSTLLGVVLSFLGSNLSSAQGAKQALTNPSQQVPTFLPPARG